MKCQASLNVERKQRLKNQSDQSITFTNLIKEMKDPSLRHRLGQEAAMLRYMGQAYYNDKLGTNMISGKELGYPIERNFKPGQAPKKDELSADFLPKVSDENEQKTNLSAPVDN